MKKWLLLVVFSLGLAGGVNAAAAQLPMPIPAMNQPKAAAPSAAPAASASAPTPGLLNGYVPDETYKLRAGDTVSFQILEDRILEIQTQPNHPGRGGFRRTGCALHRAGHGGGQNLQGTGG